MFLRELGYFQFYRHIILQISGLSISNLLFTHGSRKGRKLSFFVCSQEAVKLFEEEVTVFKNKVM